MKKTLKILGTYDRGEYTSKILKSYCGLNGIIHEVTSPYTPYNGIPEKRNRIYFDMTRSMLKQRKIPSILWGGVGGGGCI